MITVTEFQLVSDFKTQENLQSLSAKEWAKYRKANNLSTKNIDGKWYVISTEYLPEEEAEVTQAELIDEIPKGKLSVVSFGGLAIGSHTNIEKVEISHHTFNLSGLGDELTSFNQQIEAVDNLLDEATQLLQTKAVEIELGVQQKRQRLSLLDDKILATRTQAKVLRDKVIVNTIESQNLDQEFVGKQQVLTEVVTEVKSLLA